MNLLHRRYVKQKMSETQHLCSPWNPNGLKLGFTVLLSVPNDMLDLERYFKACIYVLKSVQPNLRKLQIDTYGLQKTIQKVPRLDMKIPQRHLRLPMCLHSLAM